MARNDIQLKLLVEPGVGAIVGDERKVRQIVLNLLSNAAKFAPDGGRVLVRATMDGGGLRIGVLDTGPGIDAGDHERIFEEFRQSSQRALGSGTGLGLPLSRRFARLHGGDLVVDSELGRGSAFWLQLPSEPRVTERARGARQPRPTLSLTKDRLRVTPRRTAELLGSAALFLLLPIALLSLPRPLPAGMHPWPLTLVVVGTVLVRVVILVVPGASQAGRVVAFSMMGAVAITLAAACVGPQLAPFVTMFYVWVATNAIAYLSPRAALVQLALVAACYAGLLVLQSGHTLPFVRWELTIGMIALAALIVRRVVDRLWDVAEDERLAREEVQGVNAELAQAYQHKNEFLANMSHELRTPLNVIIGFADVLASEAFGSLEAAQASDVGDILAAARHLLSLVDDVLTLGKLEAGKMEAPVGPAVLGPLVRAGLASAAAHAESKGVRWHVELAQPSLPVEVAEGALVPCLRALSLAAVDVTPEGAACTVEVHATPDGLQVVVVDEGPTLSADDRHTLLEEMVGATPGHDTQQALRLALVQRFAALQGGRLAVTAGPRRRGNRWELTIPLLASSPVAGLPT